MFLLHGMRDRVRKRVNEQISHTRMEADGLDLDRGCGMREEKRFKKYFLQESAVVSENQVDLM